MAVASVSIWLQLGSRTFRGRALPWPEELTVILLIYLTFFAAGALFKMGAHIEVDYFFNKLIPSSFQPIAMKVVWSICLAVFVILLLSAWRGLGVAMRFTSGAAIAIPRGYLRLPMIYMCATNILACVVFILTPVPAEDLATELEKADQGGSLGGDL